MADKISANSATSFERGFIYLIKHIASGKGYVGLTRRTLKERFQGHLDAVKKRNRPEGTITYDIAKYGREAFSIELLEEVFSLQQLSEREIFFIKKLGTLSPSGYNQNRGGSLALSPITHLVDGVGYRGIGQLADAYDLLEETVRARLSAKWSIEQAVGLEPPPTIKRKGKLFHVGGKVYESEVALTKAYKIPIERFRARLYQMNWSIEEALGLIYRPLNQITLEGKNYDNVKLACDSYGLNHAMVSSRLKLNWTIEEAFGLRVRNRIEKSATSPRNSYFPLTIDGRKFETAKQLAEIAGLTPSAIRYRLLNGWAPEDLLRNCYKKPTGKKIEVNGVCFNSLSEACRAFSIKRTLIQSRLNMGWSIEEAFGLKNRVPTKSSRIYVVKHPNGKISEVPNLAEFCRQNSLPSQGNLSETLRSPKHHTYLGFSLIEVREVNPL